MTTTASTARIHRTTAGGATTDRVEDALWKRMITAAPDAMLVPLLWLCVVVTVTIMFRVFTPWLVVPIVVIASVLTWRWRPTRYLGRFGWQSSLTAMVGALAWLAVNAPFASRWVVVTRDPGFLTIEGIWLSRHRDPNLPGGAAGHIASLIPGALPNGTGFTSHDGVVQAQGAKLVPGLTAIGGWVGGVEGVLVANLVVGAIALIAVYGFARRMVGPIWSLVATAALALSMPFVAFTRTIYTEPIVVALTFGGLTLLWVAYRSGRWFHYLAGGALTGAGGLARVDGAAVVVGVLVGLVLAVAGTTSRERRAHLRNGFLIAGGASVVVTLLGLGELALDSWNYLDSLRTQWHELLAATLVVFVLGVLVSAGPPWRWITVFIAHRAKAIGTILTCVVVVIAVVLVSRPLWYVGHALTPGSAYSALTMSLEKAQGLPVSATRSWDEQSLNWIAMYYSWIVVAAALLGLAIALRHALLKRDPGMLLAVTVVAAPSLLYIWAISITPDQIWAMRRFLPVTLPGFLVFAAWSFRALVAWLTRKTNGLRTVAAVVTCVVAVAGFGFPAVTWARANLFTAVQYGGQLGQVNALCGVIQGRSVLVVGASGGALAPALRTICGVQAVVHAGNMDAQQLASAKAAFGSHDPMVITHDPRSLVWASGTLPPAYSAVPITQWPIVLNERPVLPTAPRVDVWIGTIGANGLLTPVKAPSNPAA